MISWATVLALIRTTAPALELPRAAQRAEELEGLQSEALLRAEQSEKTLRETSERLELPIKAGGVGTWVAAVPEQPLVVNEGLRTMFGFADDLEPTQADLLAAVHEEDRQRLAATIERTRETGASYSEEFRVRLPNGAIQHVAAQGGGFRRDADERYLVTGVCSIVHEAELALRESERRLRMALDATRAGLWSWDVATDAMTWDATMAAMFEVPPGTLSLTFNDFASRVHPEDLRVTRKAFEATLRDGRPYDVIHRIRSGDSWRHVNAQALVDRDAQGQPLRVVGLCRDVTDQVAAEQGLRGANKELDEFTYVASHDLRAPLRAIDNLAQWIEEDAAEHLPEGSRKHLDKLKQRVRRMERLLDDILQFSRAGRMTHPPESIDLESLVAEVIQTVAPPPGFEVRIEGPLPTIHSPRSPLEQVFLNLLSNAIKHHDRDHGEVVVSVKESPMLVEMVVKDDGPGIPPELREKAFQMFETLKPRDHVEGSGIGLAVVRKLIQSMGGRIWIESEPDRGTAFHFTWPKGKGPKGEGPKEDGPREDGPSEAGPKVEGGAGDR